MELSFGEPTLSDGAFAALAQRIQVNTGIQVGASKRYLVRTRLAKRLRCLELESYDDYLHHLDADPAELSELVSAITTNLTSFFREPHHFDTLSSALRGRRGLHRVWSSACSTGEEPYSIAMVAREAGADVRVTATDIDQSVIAQARSGIFEASRLDGVSQERRRRFFARGVGPRLGLARANEDLRSMVDYSSINLTGPWPAQPPYDAIFCRNVLIYFDTPTQLRLIGRLVAALRPGGLLFLGHSESIRGCERGLEAVGHTAFRRTS